MRSAPAVAEGLTSASGASGDLLELCQADGAAACADGQYQSTGAAPSEDAVRRLADQICADQPPGATWATDRLQQSTADSLGAAGCLFVSLARRMTSWSGSGETVCSSSAGSGIARSPQWIDQSEEVIRHLAGASQRLERALDRRRPAGGATAGV